MQQVRVRVVGKRFGHPWWWSVETMYWSTIFGIWNSWSALSSNENGYREEIKRQLTGKGKNERKCLKVGK